MPKEPTTPEPVSKTSGCQSFTALCPDVASTEHIGEQLASLARPGEVFALYGDLGAGKTAFARGFIRRFMPTARVHSPTFNFIHTHQSGTTALHHMDLYRLESNAEIYSAGLTDYLPDSHGITLVEWAERWIPAPSEMAVQQRPWLTQIIFELVNDTTRRLHVHSIRRPTSV